MEPLDAIREWVNRPTSAPTATQIDPRGWVASTYNNGSAHQAKPDTLQVLRQKLSGSTALLAVEYEDQAGQSFSYVYGVSKRDDSTWLITGGAGGSKYGHPQKPMPWANLGGWGNKRFLCAGGRVHGDRVSMIRLVGTDGRAVDDHVENAYALLMGDLPFGDSYSVDLYDAGGELLGTHRWGGPPTR